MLKIKKRSHSANSINSEHLFSNDEDQLGPSADNAHPPSSPVMDFELSEIKRFTEEHPIGNILLRLQAQQLKGSGKKDDERNFSELRNLCEGFMKGMALERDSAKTELMEQLSKTSGDIESNIISRELAFHTINPQVQPPLKSSYSKKLVLEDAHKLAEAMKLFPMSKPSQKFCGTPGGISVVEFLQTMTLGQNTLKLSEEEFKQALLRSCTGKAFHLVQNYLDHGYDVEDIYSQLLLLHDNRPTPNEAKKTLATFRATKNMNLSKVESRIISLATLISQAAPSGPGRVAIFDVEARSGFINALPPDSQILVENIINTAASKLGRMPTFHEVVKLLTKHNDVITSDIQRNGISPKSMLDRKLFLPNRPIARAYLVNRGNQVKYVNRSSLNPRDNWTNNRHISGNRRTINNIHSNVYQVAQQRPRQPYNNYQEDRRQKVATFAMQRGDVNTRFGKNKLFSQTLSNGRRLSCSLCGQQSHEASDGCFAMRDDRGVLQYVVPTFDSCDRCEKVLSKKLHHPPQFCISRDNYPRKVRRS